MAVVIRLRQQGKKNKHSFRIVVTDQRAPRDGKYIEKVGFYNPHGKDEIQVDAPRIEYWLEKGALMSEKVFSLVEKKEPDVIKKYKEKKVEKKLKKAAKKKKSSEKKVETKKPSTNKKEKK